MGPIFFSIRSAVLLGALVCWGLLAAPAPAQTLETHLKLLEIQAVTTHLRTAYAASLQWQFIVLRSLSAEDQFTHLADLCQQATQDYTDWENARDDTAKVPFLPFFFAHAAAKLLLEKWDPTIPPSLANVILGPCQTVLHRAEQEDFWVLAMMVQQNARSARPRKDPPPDPREAERRAGLHPKRAIATITVTNNPPLPPPTPGRYRVVQYTRLLERPEPDARVVTSLRPGTKVHVTQFLENDWVRIESKKPGRAPGYLRWKDLKPIDAKQ